MPVLEFNLGKTYASMLGNDFWSKDEEVYYVENVYQRIALVLDEQGAKIEL